MDIGRGIVLGAMTALCVTGCSQRFAADLTGSQEVPSVATKATGKLMLHLGGDGRTMHYKLTVTNIENANMAHLHLGGPGKNGPVLVWLYPSSPPPVVRKGSFTGTLAAGPSPQATSSARSRARRSPTSPTISTRARST